MGEVVTGDMLSDNTGVETVVRFLSVAGACLLPLRTVCAAGGDVMHMLRPDMPLQPGLAPGETRNGLVQAGEVYFSEVLPGAVKAWKRHHAQTQYYAVPVGHLGIVLFDDREDSQTRGACDVLVLGRGALYGLLRIPCGVWYGFTALDGMPALICNAPDIPHNPEEGEKCAFDSSEGKRIPFDWKAPFPRG